MLCARQEIAGRKRAEEKRGRASERASRYLLVNRKRERKGKRKKEVSPNRPRTATAKGEGGGEGAMLDSQCGAVAPSTSNAHTHACYSVSDNTLLAITTGSHQHLARDTPNT